MVYIKMNIKEKSSKILAKGGNNLIYEGNVDEVIKEAYITN